MGSSAGFRLISSVLSKRPKSSRRAVKSRSRVAQDSERAAAKRASSEAQHASCFQANGLGLSSEGNLGFASGISSITKASPSNAAAAKRIRVRRKTGDEVDGINRARHHRRLPMLQPLS